MKKSYILAALLSMMAVVSSCSTDDGSSASSSSVSDRFGEQNIGVILSTSKAANNTLGILQDDGDGIPIYAVISDDADGFYIKGDVTTYDSGTGYWDWSGETKYTWPIDTDSYPMSFYSYYPLDDDIWNVSVVEGDGSNSRSVTASIKIGEPSTQNDLLSTVSETSVRPVSGLLPLTFDHILARVYLTLAAADGVKLYVQELTLCDVAATNSYDVMNQSWPDIASTTGSTSYTYTDFAKPAMAITTYSDDLSDDDVVYAASTDNLMILPQSITAWDLGTTVENARVELICRTILVNTSEDQIGYTRADLHPNYVVGETETSASSPLFIKIAVPVTAPQITDDMNENQWYDGYEYTYKLTLGGYNSNNGYLADDYYYDEDGNKTTLEVLSSDVGDEVTPGDICFDVKINDWGTAKDTTL